MRVRIAGLAALLLALGSGVQAQTASGMPDPGQEESAQGRPAMAMGGGRMVRGTVSSVDGGNISIKTEQGEVYQVAASPNTRFMRGRDAIKPADVHVGDGIGAMGELDAPNKTVHALFVSIVDAEQVKKMRESLGKTWISGKVTAIDELKLTILRSDKVSQVIEVDEDTSFKRGGRGMQQMMRGDGVVTMPPQDSRPRAAAGAGGAGAQGGGESITLADIKVGDQVGGQGTLKNGVFVPKDLVVADANARRRRPNDGGAASPPAEPR